MSVPTLQLMVKGRVPVNIGKIKEIQLLELLGTGAFGSVWKVADCASKQIYVLKVIQGLKPGSVMLERVRLEAGVSIPSKYIIPVIGLRQWDDYTFLILFEYCTGQSLDKLLATRSLTNAQKQKIFQQILAGVSDAHRCNIIHRDLKPANILVDAEGNVKIIDFGVSKFKSKGLTADGEIIGTDPYMAPEIWVAGAKNIDARADIYSLGHVFYELAMGEHFWTRKGWWKPDNFIEYLTQSPPPTDGIELGDFRCEFYRDAAAVLSRMVKINPDERYHSIGEIISALGGIPEGREVGKGVVLRYPLLIVESGSNKGARSLVNVEEGGALIVGRTDIAGADESISRRHLEFTRKGDRYFVRDAGSKNGTLLRGKVLGDSPVEIYHSDALKVGDVFLRVAFLGEA